MCVGSSITDFKQIVKGMGGEVNASQVVLSSSSTDSRLITKGPGKNTEGKRCYMVPISGLSKVWNLAIIGERAQFYIYLGLQVITIFCLWC